MPAPIFNSAALDPYVRAALVSKLQGDDPASASTAPAEKKGIGAGPYAAMIGGNAADAISSDLAIGSGRGREANGLMPSSPVGISLAKGGSTLAIAFAMHELAKKYPTLAKIIGYGDGAAMGAVAAHNMSVGR